MKVFLPSKGFYGQKVVNMRIPTFGDLHDIQTMNDDDFLRKWTFVTALTDMKPKKITYWDFEYLFNIAGFSVVFNCVKPNLQCSEGHNFKTLVKLTDLDVKTLELPKSQHPFHKRINGTLYKFNLLTAQQVYDAYETAQFEEHENIAFEDLKVAQIMECSVEKAQKLPISIYAGALIFQNMYYHGLDNDLTAVCPECHEEIHYQCNLSSSVLKFDISSMLDRFTSVSDRLSFVDFLSMSILDFNSFVESLNKKQ